MDKPPDVIMLSSAEKVINQRRVNFNNLASIAAKNNDWYLYSRCMQQLHQLDRGVIL